MYRLFLFLGVWLYLGLAPVAQAPANHAEKFSTDRALLYTLLDAEGYRQEARKINEELTTQRSRLARLDGRQARQRILRRELRERSRRASIALKKSTRIALVRRDAARQAEAQMVRRREGALRSITADREAAAASLGFTQRLRRGLALVIISLAIAAAVWLLWKPGFKHPSRARLLQASGILGCACALFILGHTVDEPKRYHPPSTQEKALAALATPNPYAQAPRAVRKKQAISARALRRYQRDRKITKRLQRQTRRASTTLKKIGKDRRPLIAPIRELESRKSALAEVRAESNSSP